MTLLKLECSNMTKAMECISKKISSYNIGEIVEELMIKELLQFHPTKNIDINNIEWLKIKKHESYKTKTLFYKYKNNTEEDDISWKLCIRNLYGKYKRDEEYKKDVKTAFRNESHIGSKTTYFNNNTKIINNVFVGICSHCNNETEKITTDHYNVPFIKIFDTFCKKNNIELHTIDIYENNKKIIRLKDENLAKTWLQYHDDEAQYRLLCRSCNSHFGSYGYQQ